MSLPNSLTLYKLHGATEEVLATASLYNDDQNNLNLHNAMKTSSFSPDLTHESFINLRWRTATKDLDGQYRCELDALDSHNSLVKQSDSHKLTLTGTDPAMTLTPGDVTVGLTRMMTLNCSVKSISALGMKALFSIDLKAVRNGQGVVLSSAHVVKGNEIFPGSEDANITAHLGSSNGYLAMSWPHPQNNLTGRYICEVNGFNSGYSPVNFVRYVDVDVTTPTQDQLVAHIQTWEQKYGYLTDQHNVALNTIANLTDQLQPIERSLDVCLKSQLLPERCDQIPYETGTHLTTLKVGNNTVTEAICEFETPSQVWTVFQRRFDGSVSFDRNFSSYEDGFGSASGEFWLGFTNLKTLMGNTTRKLRVTFRDYHGTKRVYTYNSFKISDGPRYTLTAINGPKSSHGLTEYSSGYDFSTMDHGPQSNCAKSYGGGWWYRSCSYVNLNGRNHTSNGFVWYDIAGSSSSTYNLHESEMKFL